MRFLKYFLFSFSVLAFFYSSSQTIVSYSEADGLLNNYVKCVAVDSNDNIWFGTAFGVSMFDGSSWTSYDQSSYPLMLSNDIKAITATTNGDIWIGTDYGVNKLHSGVSGMTWLPFTTNDGLANNKVTRIDEAPNGDLWFSHSSFSAGASVFDGSNWMSYNSPDLPISGVCATSFSDNGDIWFASPLDGLAHFDGTNFTNYSANDGLLSNYSTSVLVDNSNNIWLGSQDGMTVMNSTANQFTFHTIMYTLPPPDTLNPVTEIAKDSWGRIWTTIYVGYLAEGGVAYWDGNQWFDFDHSDGIAGPNVKSLAIDSQNNIWVATTTGVSKISAIPSSLLEIKNMSYHIYPNPSSNHININFENNSITAIKLFDNLGKIVKSVNEINRLSTSLDISNFNSGIYYLQILVGNELVSQKIIVN